MEAADGLGAAHRLDPHLADIRCDLRILQRAAMAEHAEARHQRQPRHRVEHGALDVVQRVIGFEIGAVVVGEGVDMALDDGLVVAGLVGVWRRNRHRSGLDADRQIGRRHAASGIVCNAGRVDEIDDGVRSAEIADHAVEAAFATRHRDRATQHRRDRCRRCELGRQCGFRCLRLAVLRHIVFGHVHIMDHAVIGLLRIVAEGEDAMLVEDQAFDAGVGVVDIGGHLGEVEARLDVGHVPHLVAEHGLDQRLAVRLVDDGEDRGRMRVVDEFMRQEGVQQRLDRWIGGGGVDEVRPLQRHHVLVGEAGQRTRLQQRAELDRRQALRLDHTHVPAAALDAQHVPFVADEVYGLGLAGSVAAAMQHQPRLAAEQPGGVDAQREVAGHALFRIIAHQSFRVVVIPKVLHVAMSALLSLMLL
ncbi:hypothetical protein X758_00925 [Mesorhizobium sp. LSHC416B00]|nr:hypothetical protein X758_00925 [Mesorhizobium sp. LSHC416B00]